MVESPATESESEEVIDQETDVEETDEKGKGDKGRTLDNVRGELVRKQDRLEQSLRNEIRELRTALLASKPAAKQEPANELDAMSVSQLENLRAQVPEGQKEAFEAYLSTRRTEDLVEKRFSSFTAQQEFAKQRAYYTTMAVERYPDLKDYTSDFAREVDQMLSALDPAVVARNPRVVYDLANDIAIQRDVRPRQRRVVSGKTATTRTSPAPAAESKAKIDPTLAAKLKRALPKGKDFNTDRLKERAEYYSEHLSDHIQKKA